MVRPRYLVVHKTEWDRIQRQASPPDLLVTSTTNEHVQGLINQSQEWIKSWPDSMEGQLLKLQKRKERQHQKELTMVKAFEDAELKKKADNIEAIEKARQLIFETNCHGKQLTSALLESKAQEERKLQIEFHKFMKQMELEQEEALMRANTSGFTFCDEADKKRTKKQQDLELAEVNKALYEMKIEKIAKEKEAEKLLELEDARLMKLLLDHEEHDMDHCKSLHRQAVEEYEADEKKIRDQRAKREEIDESLAKVWKNYQDCVRQKQQRVLDVIHKERENTSELKKNYELVEKLIKHKTKRYDQFVEKGVKRSENRILKAEQEGKEKQNQARQTAVLEAENNKINAEIQQMMKSSNKCFCDRQSLFTKSNEINAKKEVAATRCTEKPPSFLAPYNKLQQALNRRKMEPTPWTGLSAAHGQFAQQAGNTLSECRYKTMARKVVDDYRKLNCLDATTLPVPNY